MIIIYNNRSIDICSLSYCYTVKSFNGQIDGHEDESVSAIFSLAEPLLNNKHVPPIKPEIAVSSFLERANEQFPNNKTLLFSVLRDGCVVLQRKDHVLRCLDHVRSLVSEVNTKGAKKAEKEDMKVKLDKDAKKKLFLARKKIEFYIAWTKRFYDAGRFGETAMVLGLQWQSLFGELRRRKEREAGNSLRILKR